MKRPRFRAKLWMLIVLVALVALGFGAERTVRRSRAALARAVFHSEKELNCRRELAASEGGLDEAKMALASWLREPELARAYDYQVTHWRRRIAYFQDNADLWQDRLDFHTRMRKKWERALRFPWPLVTPDPPAPARRIVPYPRLKLPLQG